VVYQINTTNIKLDSLEFTSFADTIICDMVVKNPDPEDMWTEKWLKQLKRKEFIDIIFNEIYKCRLVAYDYYTNKILQPSDVKKIEKQSDFNRNIIGKFQFNETWYYDNKNHSFIKKVNSIIFGYETYDDKGYVKGYKPLFKIVLN